MAISTTFTLKFAGDAVERGLARVQSSFKSLGRVAIKISKSLVSPFAGIAAAVGGLLAAGALANAAIEMNEIGEAAFASEKRLENTIKSMGIFGDEADKVSKRLIDLGDEQARLTGIDDDTIRLTQSKLMTFKELAQTADVVGGSFDRATIAAIDMASAGFGSAETNAVQLGKALNDPIKGITALARSGITFTSQEKERIALLVKSNQTLKAQDLILQAIEKQVGGASIATSTASGRMKQSWEQLKEEFGKPFSIHLGDALSELSSKMPMFAEKFAEFGSLIGKTIQDAVNGDLTRFFMIGSMIGEAIGGGLKMVFSEAWQEIGNIMTQRKNWITGEVNPEDLKKQESDRQYLRESIGGEVIEKIRKQYAEAVALPTALPQKSGPHPNMQGISYAPANHPSQMLDEKGYRIMFDVVRELKQVNQKLSPQP